MKTLLIAALIVTFAVFAWFSLPHTDRAGGVRLQYERSSGLLLSVDEEKGMVTVSHGAMPALAMPPMTMDYSVKDRAPLAGLRPMQKVEFQVAYDGKVYVITDIKHER